jgi:hypothetical protein
MAGPPGLAAIRVRIYRETLGRLAPVYRVGAVGRPYSAALQGALPERLATMLAAYVLAVAELGKTRMLRAATDRAVPPYSNG